MSAVASAVMSRLAEIVGEAHLVGNSEELASYRIGALCPSGAVRPGTAEEVAEVMKFASTERLGVVACGARTKLEIGFPPRKYDLAIDLTRLDHIVAYDPDDLTLSVEAGITVSKLSAVLAERGQFLPLAVPFWSRATAGGTIVSGVDSPLRQGYGTARDFILGMGFVTGDGILTKSGGRVVKNVTGYDLHKLMIGSLGTLGVVTKINFRTFPSPGETRAFVANFESMAGALDMRARLSRSPLKPLTTEVLSPGVADLFYSGSAARIEARPLAANVLTGKSWAVTAGFAGSGGMLGRYEREMRAIAERSGMASVTFLQDEQVRGAFGRKREFVPIAQGFSPAATILKASVLPSRMGEILAEIDSTAASACLRWAGMARGAGVIYAALLPDALSDDSRARVVRTAGRIQTACDKAGGHATIPWCPDSWKLQLRIWGSEGGELGQMRKLKTAFDPQGILSPGRFVGGI